MNVVSTEDVLLEQHLTSEIVNFFLDYVVSA